MDKLHTILVSFMTYTTTLRGKHRTLTGYWIRIWIRNRVTSDYIRLMLMRDKKGDIVTVVAAAVVVVVAVAAVAGAATA